MPNSTPTSCANCGAALVLGNTFCEQRGQAVAPSAPPNPTAKPSVRWGSGFLLIIFAASLGVGGAVFWNRMRKDPDGSESFGPLRFPSSVTPTPRPSERIVPPVPDTSSPSGELTKTPPDSFERPKNPVTPANPVGTPIATAKPPVEVAYVHFLDEVHRCRGGKISVGSPRSSPTRIEVAVTADGTTEKLFVLEKTNTGTQATVVVGPKDAGAVRSYTLTREPNGWVISNFQDLDQ